MISKIEYADMNKQHTAAKKSFIRALLNVHADKKRKAELKARIRKALVKE